MNMGKKDLDTWGRDKARKRYEDGGRTEHPALPAARDLLAKKFQEQGNSVYRGPDIPNPKWRDPVSHHPMAIPNNKKSFPYDSSQDKVKKGGRIKK